MSESFPLRLSPRFPSCGFYTGVRCPLHTDMHAGLKKVSNFGRHHGCGRFSRDRATFVKHLNIQRTSATIVVPFLCGAANSFCPAAIIKKAPLVISDGKPENP